VTILAGGGQLPLLLVRELEQKEIPYKLIAFRGFAERQTCKAANAVVHLLDLTRIRNHLEQWQSEKVTLVGDITRPNASALLSAFSLVANYTWVKEVISKGDDNLLRGAVTLLESWGCRIIGVHELMPEIMASAGILGQITPIEEDHRTLMTGFDILDALSPFDIGQALVLTGERVLAMEGPEGTDQMLKRVKRLQKRSFFSKKIILRGALVKTAKKGQDLRFDMPAIGPRTIRNVWAAGLHGIAVGSGSTLIVNKQETITTANQLGIYLLGFNEASRQKYNSRV